MFWRWFLIPYLEVIVFSLWPPSAIYPMLQQEKLGRIGGLIRPDVRARVDHQTINNLPDILYLE